jgi:hypothetical protein
MKPQFMFRWIVIFCLLVFLQESLCAQTNFIWGKQFGSDKEESGLMTVTDQSGNVYIAGNTNGDLTGRNFGKSDGYITKIDSSGNIVWTKQFGTLEDDKINDVKIDNVGNLYATGFTKGVMAEASYGQEDLLVIKLNNAGNIDWQKQYGTDSTDVGYAIYLDNQGNIFISGSTKGLFGKSSLGKTDGFLLKLDNSGNKQFVSQYGTSEDDAAYGIAGDGSSHIFVCGGTWGDLASKNNGKIDAILGKFNHAGEPIKIIQFGTDNFESASRIAIDNENNIYLGGSTGGDLSGKQQGEGDAFLAKLSENMDITWIRQFGTIHWDGILGLDLNEKISDNIIVSGCQNWPDCQSFIRMYSKDGSLVWIKNFVASGKSGGTCGKGVCMDGDGNIYHTGLTGGNLFNTNQGEHDIFIVKQELDKSQPCSLPGQETNDEQCYGQKLPGIIPEIYKPEFSFLKGKMVDQLVLSPDCREACYVVEDTSSKETYDRTFIYYTQIENGKWKDPEIAYFGANQGKGSMPRFSPDGNMFSYSYKGDFWTSEKKSGQWSLAEKMPEPVNSDKYECGFSMVNGDRFYFASGGRPEGKSNQCDIYCAEKNNGTFGPAQNLSNLNTERSECVLAVSPDEKYIIFTRYINKSGNNAVDLYISFHEKDGTWTGARELNPPFNSTGSNHSPRFSSDGKYFFYSQSTIDEANAVETRHYWVSTRVFDKMQE